MNDVKVFENEQFGTVRTLEENGKVLFCGKDIAVALGYSNPRDALNRHCKGVVKRDGVSITTNQHGVTSEQTVEMSYIPEGDVYRLIINSRLPQAQKVEEWVFDDILPSIRKHGMYATDELINNPDVAIAAFTALKHEREERRRLEAVNAAQAQELEAARPKVEFADAVESSDASISVGETAKLLRQNGIDTGEKRFFKWLREHGYLIKNGCDRNLPTQKSMEMRLFEIKESTITLPDGRTRITGTPKVTGKGQRYFINLFLNPSPAL